MDNRSGALSLGAAGRRLVCYYPHGGCKSDLVFVGQVVFIVRFLSFLIVIVLSLPLRGDFDWP